MSTDLTPNELMQRARVVAQGILDGIIQPNLGCAELGEINHILDYPSELGALGLLAHEQYDHESLGITAENCIPDIINECKNLLSAPA